MLWFSALSIACAIAIFLPTAAPAATEITQLPEAYMIYYRIYDYSTDDHVTPSGSKYNDVEDKTNFELFMVQRYGSGTSYITPLMMRRFLVDFKTLTDDEEIKKNAGYFSHVVYHLIDDDHNGVITIDDINTFRTQLCLSNINKIEGKYKRYCGDGYDDCIEKPGFKNYVLDVRNSLFGFATL